MRKRLVNWPLLLSTVFLLAACDRKHLPEGRPSPVPSSLSEERSPIDAREAKQGVEKTIVPGATNPVSATSSDRALPLPQKQEGTPAEVDYPPHGGPLLPEEAHRLLTGKVIFNPAAIPSSNMVVGPDTLLSKGQDLQVKYGNTWWAGTILGFEPDGRVRIHYFGWAASWDEPKTRAELQLDTSARVRALDSTYVRKNW